MSAAERTGAAASAAAGHGTAAVTGTAEGTGTGDGTGGAPSPRAGLGWTAAGLVIVVGLAGLVSVLTDQVPALTEGTGFGRIARSIEYPVYAIALGFAANAVLSVTGVRRRMAAAFRTELFIKVGLVLLGASVNFAVVVRAAGPAVLQAVLLITVVFAFTWWFAGLLGVDDRLRALLASALSICGVSAAVAAAGAVEAKKEQLAYTATLVIVFAVPAIFLLPWLAGLMGLSPAVTGAWIGGNIDTTAAVTAAGAVAGEQPLQIASIVKVTQNALLGVVAVLLTLYFSVKVAGDAAGGARRFGDRRSLAMLWQRFPKFVLGFLLASVVATVLAESMPAALLEPRQDAAKELQVWALTLAFVSIGLEFDAGSIKEAGWKPIAVFAAATLVNLVVGLGLAVLLFRGFTF
ncbi:YeiH family protein [Brachybacterium saurashtrense]|uniref:Sulfate exporter family transporter n=1 Tax=Brachybacterium saurashtrense TaxID=556288 RepID=A0A345YP04_9MICO|nr:putative sulfate exporter family transporter [Brachybacterium saurashtrense]AXK45656.1 putative sulfate exporter family transporter [Brachybacterium saurashtrense]RRR24673.1 putative sulfate exporter family transporter [Brachybacterium saurashtrense]